MKKSAKSKSNVHVAPIVGRGYGANGPPLGSAAPTRSSKPEIANTPSPGSVKYEGDAASQASPSGDNPHQQSKDGPIYSERA